MLRIPVSLLQGDYSQSTINIESVSIVRLDYKIIS